ncbi:MAG TPA: methyltransferase domain-containing protein, partial [Candidatus Polarisedimenticolia bacterium]|nr:methyltransferase domain-containing protein [Candidatus Polarisedimenticolia bacterium]
MNTTPPDNMPRRVTVADRYSADAEVYEKTWAPVLRPRGKELLECLPLALARRVLDAGSGVGALLGDIQEAAPSADVFAVDCSIGMLVRAPERFPRVIMDVLRLGFAPATFDVVVLAFMLFHLEEPQQALREVRRVLRPGGTVGTITWDGEPAFPAELAFEEELDAAGAVEEDRGFTRHEPLGTPARMREQLLEAGYAGVHAWSTPFALQYRLDEF